MTYYGQNATVVQPTPSTEVPPDLPAGGPDAVGVLCLAIAIVLGIAVWSLIIPWRKLFRRK